MQHLIHQHLEPVAPCLNHSYVVLKKDTSSPNSVSDLHEKWEKNASAVLVYFRM